MNSHNPFNTGGDGGCTNDFRSADQLVDRIIGDAYHVVKEVYLALGNLTYIYNYLQKYGLIITVDSEDAIKDIPLSIGKFARVYNKSETAGYYFTDYLYVADDTTGIPSNDPTATGSWLSTKATGSNASFVRIWKYRAEADGITSIELPTDIPIVGVQTIYVEGVRQDINEGFSYNEGTATITLADSLEAGNLVTVIIGITDPDLDVDVFAILKNSDGASNIGTQSGETVQAALDSLQESVANVRTDFANYDGLKLIGQCKDVDTLRTIPGVTGQRIFLKEYAEGSGLGGGMLIGISSSSRADDGVTFFRVNNSFGWARDVRNGICMQDGGAIGNASISGTTITGADDTDAVLRVFSTRLPIVEKQPAKYRLTRSVTLGNGAVSFEGLGSELTTFVYDHLSAGLTFGPETNSVTKYPGKLKGCGCVRPNYLNGPSSSGPKSFSFGNFSPFLMEDVKELNAIGYGIFFVFCNRVTVRDSYAGYHQGTYASPKAGSDGMHFYKCTDVWAYNNVIEEIGDDALSSGSFDPLFPCSNINFINNRINRVHGTIKLYSYVDGAIIEKNIFKHGHEGGVYLTNDKNSLNNSYVRNVRISDNEFYNIVGLELTNNTAGGVRLRFWPDDTVQNSVASIDNIHIYNNTISECGSGVAAVTQDNYKRFSNLFINSNTFKDAPLSLTGSRPFIRIHQCDNNLEITDNRMFNSHSGGIYLDHVSGSITGDFSKVRAKISYNTIDGYGLSPNLGQLPNGILVRPSDYNIILELVGNQVRGQAISDTLPARQGILVNNVSPLSFIEANQSDNNIAIGSGSAAYKGIGKTKLGAPNAGTHYASSTITDYVGGNRYTILTDGTFGTLNDVTGTTVAGSKTVTLNNITNVYRGCVIAIAGVSGSKRVLDIQGTTIKVDVACDASVTDGAVSYVAPTFRTEAM